MPRRGVPEDLVPLSEWGDTTLGMVTGNNKYFSLSGDHVRKLGLKETDIVRLSPPGSRHLRGLSLTDSTLGGAGQWGTGDMAVSSGGDTLRAGVAIHHTRGGDGR